MRRFLALIGILVVQTALAQSPCVLPDRLPAARAPRIDYRNVGLPVDYYVLALSWSPEFCARSHGGRAQQFQCQANRFGFVVHGLWPQNAAARSNSDQPRNCRPGVRLDLELTKNYLCIVPGVQLMQDEWAKHGSCAFDTPQQYYGRIGQLWGALHMPDLNALAARSGGSLKVAAVKRAFVEANRQNRLSAENVVVTVESDKYVREVEICYGKSFGYQRCGRGGAPDELVVRVRPR
jgi:ribonuclease T2